MSQLSLPDPDGGSPGARRPCLSSIRGGSCCDHTWSPDRISLPVPEHGAGPFGRRPIRKRVCIKRVAALRTHLRPFTSFSRPLHHFPLQLALISPRMPHTMIKSTGSAIRLPVPLQPGRVRATTPVPRYKRWRSPMSINRPLVRVTARETSPLL